MENESRTLLTDGQRGGQPSGFGNEYMSELKNPVSESYMTVSGSSDEKLNGTVQVLDSEQENAEEDCLPVRPAGHVPRRRLSSTVSATSTSYSAQWAENRLGLLGRVSKPPSCLRCCFSRGADTIDENEPARGIWQLYWSRLSVLVILLLTQSLSSIILREYEDVLDSIVEITIYLTMLIGAGGNFGNQVCIDVVRALAVQELEPICAKEPSRKDALDTINSLFRRETVVGFMTSVSVCGFGWGRVYLFEDLEIANAITASLFLVTFTAVIVGAFLPIFFINIRIDPAHAGPTSQVLMDIIGVTIVCNVCKIMLADRID